MPIEIELPFDANKKAVNLLEFSININKMMDNIENSYGNNEKGYSNKLVNFAIIYNYFDINRKYISPSLRKSMFRKLIAISENNGVKYSYEISNYFMQKLFGKTIEEANNIDIENTMDIPEII